MARFHVYEEYFPVNFDTETASRKEDEKENLRCNKRVVQIAA